MKSHEVAATPDTVHWGYFDGTLNPIYEIASGDTLTLKTVSGGSSDLPENKSFEIIPEHLAIH